MSDLHTSLNQPRPDLSYTPGTTDRDQQLAQVEERFRCEHPNQTYRRKIASNGVTHYRMQCVRCGNGTTIKKSDIPSHIREWDIDDFDQDLQRQWWQTRNAARLAVYEDAKAAENAAWWASYNAYLASSAWQARRRKVLDRAGGLCEGCRAATPEQVHHLTYERVGREMLFDLVAVCGPCHESIHPHMADQHPVTVL